MHPQPQEQGGWVGLAPPVERAPIDWPTQELATKPMHQTESRPKKISHLQLPYAQLACIWEDKAVMAPSPPTAWVPATAVPTNSTSCLCDNNKTHPSTILPAGSKMHPDVAEEWFRTGTAQIQHVACTWPLQPLWQAETPTSITSRQPGCRSEGLQAALLSPTRQQAELILLAPPNCSNKDCGQTVSCVKQE
jgi:hypothetical protein